MIIAVKVVHIIKSIPIEVKYRKQKISAQLAQNF